MPSMYGLSKWDVTVLPMDKILNVNAKNTSDLVDTFYSVATLLIVVSITRCIIITKVGKSLTAIITTVSAAYMDNVYTALLEGEHPFRNIIVYLPAGKRVKIQAQK